MNATEDVPTIGYDYTIDLNEFKVRLCDADFKHKTSYGKEIPSDVHTREIFTLNAAEVVLLIELLDGKMESLASKKEKR